MKESGFLSPADIAAYTTDTAVKKANTGWSKLLVLGFLAGAFIAFASEGSTMAAFNLLAKPETYGLGKALAGTIFGAGLMFVIIAGGELFTGNTLMLTGVLHRRITIPAMLRNWALVYAGNFIGSLFIAWMMSYSGLFHSGADGFGGMTVRIAAGKTALEFGPALVLGLMCNWLVCLAVWMAYGAKDITGKVLVIFFAIWLFITSGFEHSVANMYYIPAGIFAKANAAWAGASGLSADALDRLNWGAFFLRNLLPVTLGNILGGGVFVGMAYWLAYLRDVKKDG